MIILIDDKFKLALSLQVLREQRNKLMSDFTDKIDYNMFKGLYRYEQKAEYGLYAELYHVMWIDGHWNKVQNLIEDNIPLQSDRREVEVYFSECFLRLVENFSMTNGAYSISFYEILAAKKNSLRSMIAVSSRHERICDELAHAIEKHRIEYLEMIKKFSE